MTEVKLDWVPPGISSSLASKYLRALPQEYVSIKVVLLPQEYVSIQVVLPFRSTSPFRWYIVSYEDYVSVQIVLLP